MVVVDRGGGKMLKGAGLELLGAIGKVRRAKRSRKKRRRRRR